MKTLRKPVALMLSAILVTALSCMLTMKIANAQIEYLYVSGMKWKMVGTDTVEVEGVIFNKSVSAAKEVTVAFTGHDIGDKNEQLVTAQGQIVVKDITANYKKSFKMRAKAWGPVKSGNCQILFATF